jgi:TetR/AcrR family transcriptional regulator, transcriptional repressor for nem operon
VVPVKDFLWRPLQYGDRMARALEFDYTTALERGSRLFWETGYSNTSLRDLLKKMGIGEGSFYNTLKSKKNAYLECLNHYNATVNRKRGEALFSAPTAAAGVRALFQTVLDCLDDPHTPSRLCLMAGSITPTVLAEPDLHEYIEQQMSMVADGMVARLAADKDAGLLPEEFDPQIVVPIIITYLQGMWRMALVSYNRTRFERQIDLFLTSLGL